MRHDGTLLEANQTALAAGGLSRNDVIGKPFWECYWWNYDSEVAEMFLGGGKQPVPGGKV